MAKDHKSRITSVRFNEAQWKAILKYSEKMFMTPGQAIRQAAMVEITRHRPGVRPGYVSQSKSPSPPE